MIVDGHYCLLHRFSISNVAADRLPVPPLKLQHQVLGEPFPSPKPNHLAILVVVLLLLEGFQVIEHLLLHVPNTLVLADWIVDTVGKGLADGVVGG